MKLALVATLALSLSACFGTPSPLAPGLHGAVGAPHQGVQTDAVELPVRGEGFTRFRPHGPNYWGRPRLVEGIERAAEALQRRFPDAPPLLVGDLSAKAGGRIPGHNSHRTGRDVDLLFLYTTPSGAALPTPGFIHVESDGLAVVEEGGDYARLDVEREWALIKLLVSDPELGVQFIFISRTVEALLIEYALSRGEPLELVWRAQAVMLEPGDSTPHDDHAHVRIACSPEEALGGCMGGGPLWEWLPEPPRAAPLDAKELAEIGAEDPMDSEAPAPTAASGGP
ncbi:MAG TPA: penicillin-insensitive murein endopeptidase [Polyangiaceae bacterium]|jgi:penicillin-insensitive murein endopeptidase|nr:penicillin-insensitive murein endopeptidase [Polyangiaceae bacterium]